MSRSGTYYFYIVILLNNYCVFFFFHCDCTRPSAARGVQQITIARGGPGTNERQNDRVRRRRRYRNAVMTRVDRTGGIPVINTETKQRFRNM